MPVKIHRSLLSVVKKFPSSPRFSLHSVSRCRCLSGLAAGGFSVCGSRKTTHLWVGESSYPRIALRPWRAARDLWISRKGRRRREWQRAADGERDAARSGTWHTYCLPFQNLEPKGSLLLLAPLFVSFSVFFCLSLSFSFLSRAMSIIEKLIFQIKSLIRARGDHENR